MCKRGIAIAIAYAFNSPLQYVLESGIRKDTWAGRSGADVAECERDHVRRAPSCISRTRLLLLLLFPYSFIHSSIHPSTSLLFLCSNPLLFFWIGPIVQLAASPPQSPLIGLAHWLQDASRCFPFRNPHSRRSSSYILFFTISSNSSGAASMLLPADTFFLHVAKGVRICQPPACDELKLIATFENQSYPQNEKIAHLKNSIHLGSCEIF